MNHVTFEDYKKTTLKNLLDTNSMEEEYKSLWSSISSGSFNFEKENLVEEIKKLTKDNLVDFAKRYTHPDSSTRTKLTIQLQSQHLDISAFEYLLSTMKTNDISMPMSMQEYVNNKPMYKECRDKLVNDFLPLMNISDDAIKNEILDCIQDIFECKAADGEQLLGSIDEVRAITTSMPPIQPTKGIPFDLATWVEL